ncbi:hypothetical protein BDP27DRAFT_1311933 [Rhodocollybia butyracea]|uniref:Uncharacterized protein n=1 Tax=Rhodocollybia butyracea TaxID=206335 RepID=A0A9P5Q902_9AGAR|nr:hypothetical protein BDP27DRAFT_1311933 [Rhodocollybia butyracea]
MLRGTFQKLGNDHVKSTSKRLSYVHNWRQKITPLELGPPSTPCGIFEFPTSPVAIISPDQLCVTSLPPYDTRTASELADSRSPDLSIVEEPTCFYDLYDAELEQMIDDMDACSTSTSTVSVTVHIPHGTTPTSFREDSQAGSTPGEKRREPTHRSLPSVIRWLPTRAKYSFLFSGVHKIFRR